MATDNRMITLSEAKIRMIVREEVALATTHMSLNESELLNEGMKETAVNILQTILAGAAEYGIAIGTLGAGAAGPSQAAETSIDLAFSAESMTSTVSAIQSMSSLTKEAKEILQQAGQLGSTLQQSREQFYEQVKQIMQRITSRVGESAEKLIQQIKENLEKLISRVSDTIGDAIKLMIPDAAIGGTIAAGFTTLVSALTDSAYDTVSSLVKKMGKYAQYILNPQAAQKFFSSAYDGTVDVLNTIADSIGNSGVIKKALMGLSAVAAPPLLRKVASTMKEKREYVLKLIQSITSVVIPTFFAAIAALQIILRGEISSSATQDDQSADDGAKKEPTKGIDTLSPEKTGLSERRRSYLDVLSEEITSIERSRKRLAYG